MKLLISKMMIDVGKNRKMIDMVMMSMTANHQIWRNFRIHYVTCWGWLEHQKQNRVNKIFLNAIQNKRSQKSMKMYLN